MSKSGQRELATQNRVVKLFKNTLHYKYYSYKGGGWQDRPNNTHIEEAYLRAWLVGQGTDEALITNAIRQFKQAATMDDGKKPHHANQEIYSLLSDGVKVRQGQCGACLSENWFL